MAFVSDNFVRADGALGGSWAAVVPNNAMNAGWNNVAGGILINNHGYGPIAAGAGDACALWVGDTFDNNQWASATVKTVAANTATLSITAVAGSVSTWTYTYTVTQGSVAGLTTLYIIVSGMQNTGNNGSFVTSILGAGTFTVTNVSGAAESGSTGTGICPSDCAAGVVVRGSGVSAATLNGYFLQYGTNSYNGTNRVAEFELWKVVNGAGTIFNGTFLQTTLPIPGDIITLTAIGSTITAYKNGTLINQVIDTSITSGVPGIWAWSLSGALQYVWADWVIGADAALYAGSNGMTYNGFQAGDFTYTQLVSDTLTEAPVQIASDSFSGADGSLGSNWTAAMGALTVHSHQVGGNSASARALAFYNAGTFSNDQYAQATISSLSGSGTLQIGVCVRANASGGGNGYYLGAQLGYGYQFGVMKNGSLNTYNNIPMVVSLGDVFSLTVVGTVLICTVNGTVIYTTTDSNFSSGNPGLYSYNTWNAGGASLLANAWQGGNAPDLSASWTQEGAGAAFITGPNGAYAIALDSKSLALAYDNTQDWPSNPNQYAQCVLNNVSTGYNGPAVRVSASSDTCYLFAGLASGYVYICKRISGTQTALTNVYYGATSGQTYVLEVVDDVLIGKINGVVVLQATDTSIASGSPGFIVSQVGGTSVASIQNWSAGALAYNISGNVGSADAIVSYTGTASGSVTADGSGNYVISGLANGSYTITPSLTGYTFSPTSASETVNGADITGVNFTANKAGGQVGAFLVGP